MTDKQIYKRIAAVMAEVGAIGKDRRNTQQNYSFRGIDDVYNVAHPLFVKHGIFSVPRVLKSERMERTTASGSTLLYSIVEMEYTFCAEDGSSVVASAVGEGMDSGDKATNKAMSAAHKYAIIQLLSIPTAEIKDSEYESHAVAPSGPRIAPAASAPDVADLDSYVIRTGKYAGRTLLQVGAAELRGYHDWCMKERKGNQEELKIFAKYVESRTPKAASK